MFSLKECQVIKGGKLQNMSNVRELKKQIWHVFKLLVHFFFVYPSQKRLIASQLKPRKGRDIKWILIENIYSLFIQKKVPKKTVYVVNQYPFNIPTFSWFELRKNKSFLRLLHYFIITLLFILILTFYPIFILQNCEICL